MSRKKRVPTEPDRGLPSGCFAVLAFVCMFNLGIAVLCARSGNWWPVVPLGVIAVVIAASWIYGRLLLIIAWWRWRDCETSGVLVFSDSPHWKPYIESEWIPRFGDRLVVLNWSQHKQWRNSLAVRIWWYFCGNSWQDFNPAVIVLRGIRHPLVYRFYPAFQQAKHGDQEGLKKLEKHLLQKLTVVESR